MYIIIIKWTILQIRGEGLVLGIEFVGNKETSKSFPAEWGK